MENIQNKEQGTPNENLDPQETKLEEDALKNQTEDEVRSSIIEKHGLDEDKDYNLIDELVSDKLEEQKKLSTAIKQKRTWREKAQAQTEQKPEEKPQPDEPEEEDKVELRINEILEKRDIDSLDLSDELKEQVRTYAKVNNVSVKEALNSEYVQFLKEKDDKKRETEEASLGGKQRGGTKKGDYTAEFKASDFDLTTPEGKAAFEEAKTQWRQTMGKK